MNLGFILDKIIMLGGGVVVIFVSQKFNGNKKLIVRLIGITLIVLASLFLILKMVNLV